MAGGGGRATRIVPAEARNYGIADARSDRVSASDVGAIDGVLQAAAAREWEWERAVEASRGPHPAIWALATCAARLIRHNSGLRSRNRAPRGTLSRQPLLVASCAALAASRVPESACGAARLRLLSSATRACEVGLPRVMRDESTAALRCAAFSALAES